MSIAPNVDLTVDIMAETTALADSVALEKITSAAEMTSEAVKIAEPAGLVVGNVFDLMWDHIVLKFPKIHRALNTEAYNTLKTFRNRK